MCVAGLCFLGLFLVIGTWCKPSFFWRSSQCLNMRSRLGNRGAEFLYYSVGGLLLVLTLLFLNSIQEIFAIILIGLVLTYFLTRNNAKFSFKLPSFSGTNSLQEKWKCGQLNRYLRSRVTAETADRLIQNEKQKFPNRPESWYLDKVVYDLKRGR